jgi:phospholipid/cholesterol/gamma-HCH transport system substrate-binding protein
MKKGVSPIAIGAFVLGSVALAMVAVMVLWSGRLFTTTHKYVLYFSGDVNGLRAGAPVKLGGVQVGYVGRVLVSLSPMQHGQPPTLTIPVIVELSSNTAIQRGTGYLDLDDPAVVKELIAQGLRGQLATESIVTGILYISLNMRPGSRAHFLESKRGKYPEIPTLPTPLQQAQELAMRALTKLGQVDLDTLLNSLITTVKNTSELTSSPQLRAAINDLPTTIAKLGAAADSIQQLAGRANEELMQSSKSLQLTSANATQTLEQTQLTLKSLRDTIGAGSPMNYQLGQTLIDVSQAARAMKQLADYLDRNPSAILRGRDNASNP